MTQPRKWRTYAVSSSWAAEHSDHNPRYMRSASRLACNDEMSHMTKNNKITVRRAKLQISQCAGRSFRSASAPGEASDQSGNPAIVWPDASLMNALNGYLRTHGFFTRTAKTGQTGRMPKLISIGLSMHIIIWLVLSCFITKTRLFKYIENFTTKKWNYQIKNSDNFLIWVQNIDCRYSLEPPRRGGSYEYPQSMFWAEIRTIMYTPVNPSFTI